MDHILALFGEAGASGLCLRSAREPRLDWARSKIVDRRADA